MEKLKKNEYFIDIVATVMFFTSIPVTWSKFSDEAPDLARGSWAFTIVCFIVGLLSGLIGDIFLSLGLNSLLSCIFAIAFGVFITGALHEDGLADVADGFGGGGSSERIIEIMHDSRLGTYGVIALVLGLSMRIGVTLSLVEFGYSLAIVLSVGFASGKLAILYTRAWFNPSDLASLGHSLGPIPTINLAIATAIWGIPILIFFPILGSLVGVIFVAFLIYFGGRKSKQKIGGITGDILGAIAFSSEILLLSAVILLTPGAL